MKAVTIFFLLVLSFLAAKCDGFLLLSKKDHHRYQELSTSKNVFEQDLDALFEKYDTDGNGSIDKQEFQAVAKRMNDSARRRV